MMKIFQFLSKPGLCGGKFLVLVEQYYRKKIGKKGEKKGKRKGEKERRKKGKRGNCWTVFLE